MATPESPSMNWTGLIGDSKGEYKLTSLQFAKKPLINNAKKSVS